MTRAEPQVHIVAAGLPMAPLLAELHKACFDTPWNIQAMSDLLSMPGSLAFVIEQSTDMPVGFVIANCAADQADILAIGILPAYRRGQLGRRLMAYLSDQMRSLGVAAIFLEVAADNLAAISLYKKCGYIEIARRGNYYDANRLNRTAVQMRCDLIG